MRQLSFLLDSSANCPMIQVFRAPELIRPEEFLGAVVQNGRIKLHGLVDEKTSEFNHRVLVVGTGDVIPEQFIDRIYKVASLVIDDSYGYHVYYVGNYRKDKTRVANRVLAFSLEVIWKPDPTASLDLSYESLNHEIDVFCEQFALSSELIVDGQKGLSIQFFDPDLRQTPEFSRLVASALSSSAVDEARVVVNRQEG